ncbi:MAG TPA: IS4 family transposase [Isosphaeraceae bacterium]|nr:IS4 family transposase [Isosphaeraceae bacterium]
MIFSDVFQRFLEDSPITVMARAILENALPPATIDQLFEDHAQQQYTRTLLFSDVVDLMSQVVCSIRPSINAAYKKMAPTLGVTRKAVYDKIDRVETTTGAALVRHTAMALTPVIDELGARKDPWLDGYSIKILDGNHLPGTEHRIGPLRLTRAGALPGHALVVLDPELMLVTDVILCEDGHAQERSLLDQVLELVRARDLWIEDRNFCTTNFLFGIAGREAFFVVRQHASALHWEFVGKRRDCGRTETGRVFEQTIRASNDAGEIRFLRRVTVVLDKPTRDGEAEIHLLTNVPRQDARARVIAELYRRRWTIETAFQELEATLQSEINTLGYPKAALFAFCIALVSYNVLSGVKAALRSVHGAAVVDTEVSAYDVAEEVAATHRGMMIAIPEDEWVVFQGMSPQELSPVLKQLAGAVRLSEYRKQPRGPKKPRPKRQSGAKVKHVATAKLLRRPKVKAAKNQK